MGAAHSTHSPGAGKTVLDSGDMTTVCVEMEVNHMGNSLMAITAAKKPNAAAIRMKTTVRLSMVLLGLLCFRLL